MNADSPLPEPSNTRATAAHTPPLCGVRVLEMGHIVAGPAVGQALADLGADVVKVESPQGDNLRSWPPVIPDGGERFSLNFAVINRNKRSIVLDFKQQRDREILLDLFGQVDVVVENFRPGVLSRQGIDIADITKQHGGLIWCSVSGFGQTGPYAERGAFDVVIQGYSGMMSVTGEPDGPPAKCGIPVGDFVAGLYAALTIVASLRRRDATGHGAVLDCSMLASLLSISSLQVSQFLGTGVVPEPLGSAHPRNAPYQAYECQDGFITIAAGTDSLWCRFCDVIGRAELRTDRRFIDQASRAENQSELTTAVGPVLRSRPRSWWLDRLLAQGIPCGPVNTFADVMEDDQVRSLEIISDLVLPNGTKTKAVTFPVRTNSWEVLPSSPPKLGEHTEEVLREWMPRPNKSK